MAILVTGGAGYIASATVDRVRAKDEEVVVLEVSGAATAPIVGDRALVARIAAGHKIEADPAYGCEYLANLGRQILCWIGNVG
jgi:nucleoside-diphosphate-sugar epimerase